MIVKVNTDGYQYNKSCRAARMLNCACRPMIYGLLKLCPSMPIVANVDITGKFDCAIRIEDSVGGHIDNVKITGVR